MTVPDRAVLYARVSYDDRESEDLNLKSQINLCKKRVAEKGYRVIDELQEDDRGASGAAFELPKLNKIRTMAARREFDVLIVRELDRLSRNLAKQLLVEEELKRAGVRIEYALAEYPNTAEGQLHKLVRGVFAEYDRLKIIEHTSDGRLNRARAGSIMVFGLPPYGYRIRKRPNGWFELVPYKAEAKIVKLIYLWYTIGTLKQGELSQKQIALRLNVMGVPPPSQRVEHKNKSRVTVEWRGSTIAKILRNETYAGTWRYGKRHFGHESELDRTATIKVPALIDQETWDAAQVKHHRNKALRARATRHDYLLARRIYCGTCGRLLVASPRQIVRDGATITRAYYRCYNSTTGARCAGMSVNVEKADTAVWNIIKQLLNDPRALIVQLRHMQHRQAGEVAPIQEQLAIAVDLIQQNREKLNRAVDLYISGQFDRDVLLERKTSLEQIIASLEDQRRSLMERLESVAMTDVQITTIQQLIAELQPRLSVADAEFAIRRQLIERLRVTGALKWENGAKTLYMQSPLFTESIVIR